MTRLLRTLVSATLVFVLAGSGPPNRAVEWAEDILAGARWHQALALEVNFPNDNAVVSIPFTDDDRVTIFPACLGEGVLEVDVAVNGASQVIMRQECNGWWGIGGSFPASGVSGGGLVTLTVVPSGDLDGWLILGRAPRRLATA